MKAAQAVNVIRLSLHTYTIYICIMYTKYNIYYIKCNCVESKKQKSNKSVSFSLIKILFVHHCDRLLIARYVSQAEKTEHEHKQCLRGKWLFYVWQER